MGSSADDKARERAEALVGRTIDGRYQIDRVLATGAMGTVYLGRHLKLKKRVAIKALHPDVEDHPDLVMRFEREAFAGGQVSHPNVARATDFGDLDDGTRYLVMEYVRGSNLRNVIDSDAPIAAERAVRIARQIAVALGHIHERGIVHRDLKPRNVMLGDADFVKVVDFGLAKIDGQRFSALPEEEAAEDARLTLQGTIFGTVEYLAPEAAFGMELVDARADLYALGVILYEMLSGKHPFEGKTDAALFAKQRHAAAPPIGVRAPSVVVPSVLEAVVQKLLQKDFDERYQTAAETIAALDHAMPSASEAPPEPVDAPPSSASPVASVAPPPSSDARSSETSDTSSPPSGAVSAESRGGGSETRKTAKPASSEAEGSSRRLFVWLALGIGSVGLVTYLARSGGDEAQSSSASPTSSGTAREVAEATATPRASSLPIVSSVTAEAPSATPPVESAWAELAPSAAPSASVSAAPMDLAAFRDRMRDDIRHDRWDDLADAARSIARTSPDAACEKATASALSSALSALSRQKSAHGEDAWREVALAKCGPDLLYAFVETGGKSGFATRAAELLRDEAVAQSASPAVRVAFELHDGSCQQKLAILERAVAEGDERAATAIDIQVRGCARNPTAVNAALFRLRARLDVAKALKSKNESHE